MCISRYGRWRGAGTGWRWAGCDTLGGGLRVKAWTGVSALGGSLPSKRSITQPPYAGSKLRMSGGGEMIGL